MGDADDGRFRPQRIARLAPGGMSAEMMVCGNAGSRAVVPVTGVRGVRDGHAAPVPPRADPIAVLRRAALLERAA